MLWGITALFCAGLAVFGSNASLLVPQGVIAGLHQPRVAGATIENLRRDVAALREDTTRLRNENQILLSRFALQEKSGTDVVRRVGALEVSVPLMLESAPGRAAVDRSVTTSSIGAGETMTFETEGGSVAVRQTSMPPAGAAQPLPAPVPSAANPALAAPNVYGVALGTALPVSDAALFWNDLNVKFGPLLLGLAPLTSGQSDAATTRLVAGPVDDLAAARRLCERFERVSVACQPMPYDGTPLVIDAQGG
ncbi:hypothetical protein VE26_07475 [Devosia chinhatensis]|uniref:SPOR domain-containing protein n=2 Tax=Devosia chinhatensis TaxID=429727 RepID=A0A0F5FLL7_9HYPH|nr:hypothetical protein VE26_07475 [Devosia chinhatensis]